MNNSFSDSILKGKGYVLKDGCYYPPNKATEATKETKKGKSRPKGKKISMEAKIEPFVLFVKQELGIDLIPEHRFHHKRLWRFDFACLEYKIAVEQEGGIHTGGRHVRGAGYAKDMEKYSEASVMGWILIRRTPSQMLTGETLDLIRRAVELRKSSF